MTRVRATRVLELTLDLDEAEMDDARSIVDALPDSEWTLVDEEVEKL